MFLMVCCVYCVYCAVLERRQISNEVDNTVNLIQLLFLHYFVLCTHAADLTGVLINHTNIQENFTA